MWENTLCKGATSLVWIIYNFLFEFSHMHAHAHTHTHTHTHTQSLVTVQYHSQ